MKILISISNGEMQYAATDMSEGQIILIEDGKKSFLSFDSVNCSELQFNELINQFQQPKSKAKLDYRTVEAAKEVLKDAGYIMGLWHEDDIRAYADSNDIKLTKKQVADVKGNIERYHDANQGINWEVIQCHIDMVKEDSKKKKAKR